MNLDEPKKEQINLLMNQNIIRILRTKAALDGKSVSEVLEALIKKEIEVKSLISRLSACEIQPEIQA